MQHIGKDEHGENTCVALVSLILEEPVQPQRAGRWKTAKDLLFFFFKRINDFFKNLFRLIMIFEEPEQNRKILILELHEDYNACYNVIDLKS